MIPFLLYAMEQEGELDTRESRINNLIQGLKQGEDFSFLCEEYNLTDLTEYEIKRIKKEVKYYV